MKKKLLLLLAAVFLTGFGAIYGQDKTVSGTVFDAKTKETLIGVTVKVKGTTEGTMTDIDGKFQLTLPEGSNTLVFEYGSYITQERQAKDGMQVLLDETEELGEVKVEIFTGATKGKGYAGNAQTITSETIEKKNPSDITKALAAEFAGVQVVTSSGQPGTTSSVRIRGINSINAGTSPLYVVDGIPYNGDITSIDPSDIATTTILKDATSTALYGSRGSNGVILITTKKGTAGAEGRIDIDVKYGFNMRLIPLYETVTDPKQYTELGWQGLYTLYSKTNHNTAVNFANENLFGGVYGLSPNYNPFNANGNELIGEDGKFIPGIDYLYKPESWAKHIFSTNKKIEATIKFSGGSEKTTYYTSFGFLNDGGYYIQSDWKRFNVRSNLDFEPKKWLKGGLNISYAYNKLNSPGQGDNMNSGFQFVNKMAPIFPVFQHAYFDESINPETGKPIGWVRTKDPVTDPILGGPAYDYGMYGTQEVVDEGGNVHVFEGWGRPYAATINPAGALRLDKDVTSWHNLDVSSRWELEFYKDLKFIADAGFQYDGGDVSRLNNMFYGDAKGLGRIYKYYISNMSLSSTQVLKYQKTINDYHQLDALVGHSASWQNYSMAYGGKSGLYNPNSLEFSNASVLDALESNSYVEVRESFIGQIKYSYNEKYFFEINGNLDLSPNFAKGHRLGKYGSVGASWNITREGFMKNTKSWLSNLRVRASFGIAGNDGIGQWLYTDLYTLSVIDKLPAIIWAYKGSPNLTWETSRILDAGFEASIKKDRLKLEVNYYYKKTDNLLFPYTVPPSLGYGYYYTNDGAISNQGVEWLITAKVVKTRNVELAIRFNGGFNRGMMLALPHETRFGEQRRQIMSGDYAAGHALGEWYLPEYVGVDKDGQALWVMYTDENKDDPNANGNYITDVYMYLNQDTEDGSLLHPNPKLEKTTTTDYNKAGSNFLGKRRYPDVIGGFGIDFSVYGFEISALFNYWIGGYGFDNNYMSLMEDAIFGETAWHKDMLNAWNPLTGNTNTDVPALTGGLGTYATYSNAPSTRFLTSNTSLQIANVKVAYYFPQKWIKKALLNSLSIWVSGENLYAFTARKGYFPFAAFSGTNNRSQYVPGSTILGGIKLQF